MDTYKPAEGSATRSDIAITDPDFKYPSLWKSNIAADYKFGDGWVATVELLYSKTLTLFIMTISDCIGPSNL